MLPQRPKKAIEHTKTPSSQNLQLSKTGLYSERSSWQSSISSSSLCPKLPEISTTFLRHFTTKSMKLSDSTMGSTWHRGLMLSSWDSVKFWMFRATWAILSRPHWSFVTMDTTLLMILWQWLKVRLVVVLIMSQTWLMNSTLIFFSSSKLADVETQKFEGIDTLNVNRVMLGSSFKTSRFDPTFEKSYIFWTRILKLLISSPKISQMILKLLWKFLGFWSNLIQKVAILIKILPKSESLFQK